MRKTLLLLAAAVMLTACQETLEERATREAREVTENKCPMPIGDNMYMDSVVFDIPTLTQTQYFRFIGDSDNDSVVTILGNARQVLVDELRGTAVYKSLMERGVNFRYVYRSTKNRETIYLDVTLKPDDYR